MYKTSHFPTISMLFNSSCAVARNSAVLSQMNEKPIKQLCDVCGVVVRIEGHEARCAPVRSQVKGWNDARVLAWRGDTIQYMDVKLALAYLEIDRSLWGDLLTQYTSNATMADYVRKLGFVGRSEHTSGTAFEARYHSSFRVDWLFHVFPDVAQRVLDAWTPPRIDFDTQALPALELCLY